MTPQRRLAGVELGGTKGIAVLAEGARIVAQQVVPTTAPRETLDALNGILRSWNRNAVIDGLGIATFGPVRLDRAAPDFGYLLETPKPGWSGAAIGASLEQGLGCPWHVDTDVNAAALAELQHGAARGCDSVCYITVGTGVGGGLVLGGRAVHGAMHPEIGHLRLRRSRGEAFAGACRFHGDCIEGLISGPALAARFAMPADSVPDDHPGWRDVAADMGELAASILLTTSARRILFGGSVALARSFLLPHVRQHALTRLQGYLPFFNEHSAEQIIAVAGLGKDAGPLGAIALAEIAAAH